MADFWISIVAAFIVYSLKAFLLNMVKPCFKEMILRHKMLKHNAAGRTGDSGSSKQKLQKPPINEKLLETKARSATDKLFFANYFSLTAFVGYILIKDKPWLPWYLGGHSGNDSVMEGFVNMPFTPMDETLYYIGLVTLGHPLQ